MEEQIHKLDQDRIYNNIKVYNNNIHDIFSDSKTINYRSRISKDQLQSNPLKYRLGISEEELPTLQENSRKKGVERFKKEALGLKMSKEISLEDIIEVLIKLQIAKNASQAKDILPLICDTVFAYGAFSSLHIEKSNENNAYTINAYNLIKPQPAMLPLNQQFDSKVYN